MPPKKDKGSAAKAAAAAPPPPPAVVPQLSCVCHNRGYGGCAYCSLTQAAARVGALAAWKHIAAAGAEAGVSAGFYQFLLDNAVAKAMFQLSAEQVRRSAGTQEVAIAVARSRPPTTASPALAPPPCRWTPPSRVPCAAPCAASPCKRAWTATRPLGHRGR